jgi:hypothetical protein
LKYYGVAHYIITSISSIQSNEWTQYILSGFMSGMSKLGIKGWVEHFVQHSPEPFIYKLGNIFIFLDL